MSRQNSASLRRVSMRELRAQKVWRSSFSGESMQRLQNEQGQASGVWRVELRIREHNGYPAISGELSGALQPVCQRCLQPMQLQFQHCFFWGLVRDDQEAALLPEELDPVQLSGDALDLCAALEDEVLLSMPVAYMHEDGECAFPSLASGARKMISQTSN